MFLVIFGNLNFKIMIWPSTNADLLDTDPNMTRFIGGVLSVLYMGKHIVNIYFLLKLPELEKKSFSAICQCWDKAQPIIAADEYQFAVWKMMDYKQGQLDTLK